MTFSPILLYLTVFVKLFQRIFGFLLVSNSKVGRNSFFCTYIQYHQTTIFDLCWKKKKVVQWLVVLWASFDYIVNYELNFRAKFCESFVCANIYAWQNVPSLNHFHTQEWKWQNTRKEDRKWHITLCKVLNYCCHIFYASEVGSINTKTQEMSRNFCNIKIMKCLASWLLLKWHRRCFYGFWFTIYHLNYIH